MLSLQKVVSLTESASAALRTGTEAKSTWETTQSQRRLRESMARDPRQHLHVPDELTVMPKPSWEYPSKFTVRRFGKCFCGFTNKVKLRLAANQ
jgi:hypothetical protein